MISIPDTFARLRTANRPALVPFIPAGYPDLATTGALLPALESAGAAAIEIGFPFSDPIADGPTIQEAFSAALGSGLRVADVFACIRNARPGIGIPLVGMLSYSIVFRYGLDRFIADARAAGLDGLILPDLPPPEAAAICARINAGGLQTTLLVAPTTSQARRRDVVELSTGFIYYLSVSGITGERDRLPDNLAENLRSIRALTKRPICVGFGISRPDHLAQLCGLADGVIVGSAIVKRITQQASAGPGAIAASIGEYCRSLLAFTSPA